ncbi:HD domain-containing protein [Thermogemmatispora sp.]|uniref:HD domain-containing protein n=1 Tax=Thermogemmatispora sp. TaxID=1968838 RepID=UPI001DFD3D82|nr:HD domain-containing protein [Thermogemmatispora sp.]MBX5448465.1 HD domain-containing protein [Thermogemmatispora sp.]
MAEELIRDPLLGEQRLSESVLLAVLHSAPLQRLKGVHQAGASYLVRAGRDTTRYEHSLGVMLLIRRLGGGLEEQLAGLLHDVSHTAFSHVADYLFSCYEEDYHEQHLRQVLARSELPALLRSSGFDLERILAFDHWPLLEQPVPELCADRVDYTLRDLWHAGYLTRPAVEAFLQTLCVWEGRIVVVSRDAAMWFVHQYVRLVTELFMHPVEMFADYQLARALRLALDEGLLREEELFLEDAELLARLRRAAHPEIARCLSLLQPGLEVQEVSADQPFDVYARVKPRMVDPLVLQEDGRLVRCSALDAELAALQQAVLHKARRGSYLRLCR